MYGCESNAVCLQDLDTEETACYTMPPCGENGACPVGLQGAVCNKSGSTEYLPNKDAICLIGVCEDAGNCPADWFCVRFQANDPLGFCSSGGFGEPCSTNEECLSGNCFSPAPGFPAFCQ